MLVLNSISFPISAFSSPDSSYGQREDDAREERISRRLIRPMARTRAFIWNVKSAGIFLTARAVAGLHPLWVEVAAARPGLCPNRYHVASECLGACKQPSVPRCRG